MICFIIYCLNCIRHGRNATFERGLRASKLQLDRFSFMFQLQGVYWTDSTCSPGSQFPSFPKGHGGTLQESLNWRVEPVKEAKQSPHFLLLQADILQQRAAEDVEAIWRNIEVSRTNPVHLAPTMERAPSTEETVKAKLSRLQPQEIRIVVDNRQTCYWEQS